MRKYFFLFAIAFSVTSCQDKANKMDEKYAPYEHFFFQRSFPDSTLNLSVMLKSVEKSRNLSAFNQAKTSEAEWLQEGPFNIGGRLNTIAVHPEDPSTWIVGTAGGGAYITDDEGATWANLTESLSHLPIGHITFDPNNPETIYIGTGDVNISGTVYIGNGLYRSTDGGENWENIGLQETRIISKIIVNPNNSDQIFVATMGIPFEAGPDRGLYRSDNGGESWEQILFVSETAGVIDLVMNPEDPSVLYAAGWNRIRTNLESIASGEDAKIFKSIDGGDSWEVLSSGLPSGLMSRIGLYLWEGNPEVLFALYVNPSFQLEGIYKSNNAGDSFETIPTFNIPPNALGGFGWYFGKIRVSPTDQDEISVLGVDLYSTTNGGNNWLMSAPPWFEYIVHADKHDMVYLGPNDVLLATDGGLYRTTDGGTTWADVDRIPNTQFYRIATSPHDENLIYGGAQDNGTSISVGDEPTDDWLRFFGGDGFQPILDPLLENLTYMTTQNGSFYCYDSDFGELFYLINGYNPEERVNWDAPFRMDHGDNSVLYMARERVYKMEDAPFGIWEPISPVLVDDSDIFFDRRNVSTIAQSEVNGEVLYAGTSDGKAWVTQNGGDEWIEISEGLPGYYVTDLKASPFNEGEVLISVSGYRDNDETPHLYLSSDYGQDWISVSGNLEEMPINHIEIYDETTWFIASDNGVYITNNNGINWQRAGANFPFVVVADLEIQEETNRLIAGTFGVSIFSVDIEELLEDIVSSTSFEAAIKIKLYPNPTQDYITAPGAPGGSEYTIFNMSGKIVLQGILSHPRIELNLPDGTYIIDIKSSEALYRNKFIVIGS
ncbi:MAG: photosystem II stability/assembly factor-like uncharacterized protein [Cryomorphaceae bacterium]|jgi:photosystem II stability/assembly factor-like uncharacterized protein